MSDVRWEPIEDGYFDHEDRDDYIELHTDWNGTQLIRVAAEEGHRSDWVILPPDIRLCRAVAAQPDPVAALDELRSKFGADFDGVDPDALVAEHRGRAAWSQEPPEWGQAWFRGVIHPDDEVETGRYYHFDDDDPAMLFVARGEVYWSKDDDTGMDAICSVSDCCGEWLPVPQPPTGEVGP